MKQTIMASIAAAGLLWALTLTLLQPAAPPETPGLISSPVGAGRVSDAAKAAIAEPEPEPAASYDASHTVTVLSGETVCEVSLSDYLTGVVLAESLPAFEPEALSAQSVAARTVALRREDHPKHEEADLCADPACCQAYFNEAEAKETYGEDWAKWEAKARAAVAETDGLVLRYEGELIDAVYFASSGGATETAAAVWGGEVPYLQSVKSPDSGERFVRETRFSAGEFRTAILKETPEARLNGDPSGWFSSIERTEGGGVKEIEIGGVAYGGVELRKLFSLRSTNFTVSVEDGVIVFTTSGCGHRVGLSQYGAQEMALDGADFREILAHYYQGTELGPA